VTPPADDRPPIPRSLVLLLAVACGLAVANMYYAQPLLDTIARSLHARTGAVGLTVTVTQLGYAAGLVLIVPLGDLVDRRRLVVGTLCLTALALLGVAAAPGLVGVCAALGVVGVTSVVAQVLVPLAATLARDDERGRVVGTVMSGLLIGILLARTLAGFLATALGWRGVYVVAAGLMAALALVLRARLPRLAPATRGSYPQLLTSVGTLVRAHPVLRRRMAYGALLYAGFGVFWTSSAFLLAGPHYRYSESVIGLFGLVGVAGALCAQASGRLADRGWNRGSTGGYIALTVVSFAVLIPGRTSVVALIAGVVLLDAGVQGAHILNQSTVYALDASARSRLTTAYMTSYFLGGAAGSAGSAALWDAAGWTGVCALGGAVALLALLLWSSESLGGRRQGAAAQADRPRASIRA